MNCSRRGDRATQRRTADLLGRLNLANHFLGHLIRNGKAGTVVHDLPFPGDLLQDAGSAHLAPSSTDHSLVKPGPFAALFDLHVLLNAAKARAIVEASLANGSRSAKRLWAEHAVAVDCSDVASAFRDFDEIDELDTSVG